MSNVKLSKTNILFVVLVILALIKGLMWYFDDSPTQLLLTVAPKPQQSIPLSTSQKLGLLSGCFELKVNLPLNKTTIIHYIIPLDEATGQPKSTASNIVFYAPYNGDAKTIAKGLKKWHRYYPEVLGYTIFSMSIEANTDIVDNPKEYYIYKESGWYDVVFRVKKRLEQEFNLQEKKLLVVGESSGGSMAQQMAVAYPEKIAAAAWCGGSKYVELKTATPVAMLALNIWGCYGVTSTIKMTKRGQNHASILRGEAPPNWKPGQLYHHAATEQIYELMHTFIAGIVDLRNRNNGDVPTARNWPCNAKVNGVTQHYPSEHFKKLWLQLPHEATAKLASGENNLLEYPTTSPPKCIVFLIYDKNIDSKLLIEDAMYCLNKNNNAVFAMKIGDSPLRESQIAQNHLRTILQNEKFQSLPIVLVGNGIGGNIAFLMAKQVDSLRIDKVITWDTNVNHAFSELSISENMPLPSTIKLSMYYYGISPVEIIETAEIVNAQKSGSLEKDWFNFLEGIAK